MWAKLFRRPDEGSFITMIGHAANWLHVLDTATADVLVEAQHRRDTCSNLVEDGLFKVRLTTLDVALNNNIADRCPEVSLRGVA